MGIAALLPGMQFMIEKMQKELDEMRTMLGILQDEPTTTTEKHVAIGKSGWPEDPQERKLEMQKRMKVRDEKRAAQLGMNSKAHPDHAKFVEKMKRLRKREWAAMSPAKRKARLAKMAAGKKKKPVVKLAEVAA
jgi:uncharacterized membrane protein